MITKDLGIATAYGYALSKGYTGTEEEFAELMASYASTAQTAVEAAERAVAAQGAAELAQGKAEDAQGVAEGKATEASGSADSASSDALKAEGLAVGQQNGTDVGSGSPYYHANAKYYKEQAAGSATTASTKAGEAAQSATDASNAKTAAQTAKGKAEDAQTAAETAQGKAEDAQEAAEAAAEQAEQTLNSYAHVDGYYEEMSVGNAEQLIANIGVHDNAPYLFRTAGGAADIGNREDDSLVGGSIAWNQQTPILDSTWVKSNNNMTPLYSDGVATLTFLAQYGYIYKSISYIPVGHKVLLSFAINRSNEGTGTIRVCCFDNSIAAQYINAQVSSGDSDIGKGWVYHYKVEQISTYAYGNTRIAVQDCRSTLDEFKVKDVMCIDLTQMFGSTIADFIYGLEQATSGSGVAWFKKYFAKPYYAYDSGSIQSVQAAAHKTVGFNAFDKSTTDDGNYYSKSGAKNPSTNPMRSCELIHVVPNTTYYIKTPYYAGIWNVVYFDVNKNGIDLAYQIGSSATGGTFTTPANCHYIGVNMLTADKDAICINLHWDGERDGEYEAYDAHIYELDSDLVLRGIPKLDTNNNLYYDGDTYKSDGTVTRKYGIVDLGTLTWSRANTSGDNYRFTALISAKQSDTTNGAKSICSGITLLASAGTWTGSADGYTINSGVIYVYLDAHKTDTAENFKTAMSGVYLVYELATPTTESADPFTNPQVVDDFGTEEYIEWGTRDVSVMVGHSTTYQANLKAKLEMSPDSPTENGDHVVRKTNDGNAYIPWESSEIGEKFAEVEADIAAKANPDGYYEQMTVGNAEQLVSTVGVEDKVPYLFRTSGGSADIGDREVDMVVGGTIAWNQRVQNPTEWPYSTKEFPSGMPFVAGHKMLAIFKGNKVDSEGAQSKLYYYARESSDDVEQRGLLLTFGENIISLNKTITANGNASCDGAVWLYIANISNAENLIVNFIDLTQMFGSTIADYIYSLEQATPGAGVAFFRKLFPKPYYAYNPGELMSVQTSAHKLVGFNAWDEEWEVGTFNTTTGANLNVSDQIRSKNIIKILPNTTYYWNSPVYNWTILYDADGNVIPTPNVSDTGSGARSGNSFSIAAKHTFITPANAYGMRFYTGTYTGEYKNDICINLSWDGERDGEYEPYTVHSYALDSDLVLRGIPKLDANNALYYDGDTYESDGTVTRRFAIVDLGTLTWVDDGDNTYYTTDISDIVPVANAVNANDKTAICSRYTYLGVQYASSLVDKSFIRKLNGIIDFKDVSCATAAAFKTAMSGVYLVYELATPTTETADPYQNPQIVDDFGTEEYVDERTVPIPVGHSTSYRSNLKAKLEMSPESPSGDGDYIVRQTNGENAYVPLSFPADELPAPPTSNGNYMLKCAVSGGTATYTWESIT